MSTKLNFDAVPMNNPMGYVNPGLYLGTIKKREVKEDQKTSKEILTVTFDLTDKDGKKAGTFTEFCRDLDKQIPMYKLNRLMMALGVQLSGEIELRLVANMIKIDEVVVLEIGDNTYNGVTRSQIQVANSQCFWPANMFQGLLAARSNPGAPQTPAPQAVIPQAAAEQPQATAAIAPNADEFPFDAADGVTPPPMTAGEVRAAAAATTTPTGDGY